MMRYAIHHSTTVDYATPMRLARFNVRLRPALWPHQTVSEFALNVEPHPATIVDTGGAYYVNESKFTLGQSVDRLHMESSFLVTKEPLPAHVLAASGPRLAALRERAMTLRDLTTTGPASYIFASPMAAPEREIALWASQFLNEGMPVMAAGRALMQAINHQFAYDPDATYADTLPIEAFNLRRGVCQDFSHVMIIAARAHGIPAAYVSGYLRTLPPPGQPRLIGVDAMHAWVNLWCGEELGWVGFDPTNDMLADTGHIFLGMGRDYSDVAPLDGTFRGGGKQTMTSSVDVAPLD